MRHTFRSLPVAIALLALAATTSARDVQAQTCATFDGSMSNLIANLANACTGIDDLVESSEDLTAAASTVPSRSVRVDADATAVAGKIYNTVAAALTYVGTQSPSDSEPWKIEIYGPTYTEAGALTIPDGVQLRCHGGGDIYFGGDATTIQATLTTGVFVTMEGGSIGNCIVRANGTPTGARTGIKCTGACTLDHVGVHMNPSANNTEVDTAIDVTPPSGFIVANFYYLVTTAGYANANSVGINVGVGAFVNLNNALISDGGGAQGKAIKVLTNSPGYITLENVVLGAPYNGSNWTVDLSNEGTGAVHASDTRYKTSSGTISNYDQNRLVISASAPATCDATTSLGKVYWDTTGPDLCFCPGAAGWTAIDGTGTCA